MDEWAGIDRRLHPRGCLRRARRHLVARLHGAGEPRRSRRSVRADDHLHSFDDDHHGVDNNVNDDCGDDPTPTPAPTPASTPAPVVLAATPPAPATPVLPAIGQATVWGCSAALAYLSAYAAPGFTLDCPGYAEGHEAMTCIHGTPEYPDACLNGPTIALSDPCPQAYMNESANSWSLTGQLSVEQAKFGVSYANIDPFGACP